ncbi:hypothetical protein PR003_g18814 [Phytophthora rubi]|uniref:Uncharacterized protein n=1 Tax=Phytophthora rubi TaxID=129364 RepID=A0A6A3KCM0_9STRA|nr:hypothetical protein PR002_g19386 [Phytophthora rubi]KAE9001643.1 hypothetical protein PR001_g18470 [Phytophthora rubi]KAE9316097.1 hypothetical protein PR003_g18814 [Phytophthora rubi]
MALAFVSAVVKDDAYLQKIWDVTAKWRAKSVDTCEQACKLAKEHGVLVSSGKPGYNLLTFVCIAVRSPEQTAVLLKAWEPLKLLLLILCTAGWQHSTSGKI